MLEQIKDTRRMKLALAGRKTTGKTSLMQGYVDRHWNQIVTPTAGIDFRSKILHGKEQTKLNIFDIQGDLYFMPLLKNYFRGTDAIILLYNITDRESMWEIERVMEMIEEEEGKRQSKIVKFLVGTHLDHEENRVISTEEAKQLAEKREYKLFQLSTKVQTQVDKIFSLLISDTIKQRQEIQLKTRQSVLYDIKHKLRLYHPEPISKNCC